MATERSYRFGRHDRITIRGAHYKCAATERKTHLLMLVVDGVVTNHGMTRTDAQIRQLSRESHFRHEPDYYSRAASLLRIRHDDCDIYDLEDDDLRTIAWKVEWCTRFNDAATDLDAAWRPTRTLDDIEAFVHETKDEMDRWYLGRFEERRRPGRKRPGEEQKAFDWPGASTLYGWLKIYEADGCRARAFRPKYENCGGREQLDPRVARVVREIVAKYQSSAQPTRASIHEQANARLAVLEREPGEPELTVSREAVNLRINKLDPFLTQVGRKGADYALRRNIPVGKGQPVFEPLERIEMDDWEVDLITLVARSPAWRKLPPDVRKRVPRVRCTLTAAIDVATRCVVGMNLSPLAPSTASSRVALRSILVDKDPIALAAGCKSDWPMFGNIGAIVTDGGPAFAGEFTDTVRNARGGRRRPDRDKRMRGYVESFFKSVRAVCRYFTGQTFSNVMQRGDYKSEEMASVLYTEFRNAVVRFAVDYYHHRPHRGLEGMTPYAKWGKLSARHGLDLTPSEGEIRRAFGLRGDFVIETHGISTGKLSYNDEKLNVLRMVMRGAKVLAFQDGEDVGRLSVSVPPRYRERFAAQAKTMGIELDESDHRWLEVDCVDRRFRGVALDEVLAADARVRELVAEANAEGKAIRYAAVLDLVETGERTRREAGQPTFVPTQAEYDAVISVWRRKSRSALGEVEHAAEPIDPAEADDVGETVAVPVRRRPKAPPPRPTKRSGSDGAGKGTTPFGGSLNMGEEDEE